MRRAVMLTSACLVVLIAGGCRHDGRTLRPAGPGQQSSISTLAAPSDTDGIGEPSTTGLPLPAGLTVTAPWRDGAEIDPRYTCDGTNLAPALSWSAAPAGTVEIAITLTDVDAPDFVHWAIAGLSPSSTSIAEDTVPIGAYEGTNGNGVVGYTGPCPPAGETHNYLITVYYLGEASGSSDGAAGLDLIDALQSAELDEGSVTGSFSRA